MEERKIKSFVEFVNENYYANDEFEIIDETDASSGDNKSRFAKMKAKAGAKFAGVKAKAGAKLAGMKTGWNSASKGKKAGIIAGGLAAAGAASYGTALLVISKKIKNNRAKLAGATGSEKQAIQARIAKLEARMRKLKFQKNESEIFEAKASAGDSKGRFAKGKKHLSNAATYIGNSKIGKGAKKALGAIKKRPIIAGVAAGAAMGAGYATALLVTKTKIKNLETKISASTNAAEKKLLRERLAKMQGRMNKLKFKRANESYLYETDASSGDSKSKFAKMKAKAGAKFAGMKAKAGAKLAGMKTGWNSASKGKKAGIIAGGLAAAGATGYGAMLLATRQKLKNNRAKLSGATGSEKQAIQARIAKLEARMRKLTLKKG